MRYFPQAIERWFHEKCLPFAGWRGRRGEGEFGARAPYWCQGEWCLSKNGNEWGHDCGPVWEEPRIVCTFRGSLEEPAEYEYVCPNCGSYEVYETDPKHNQDYKVITRKKICHPHR